jgi:hypothetical protein
MAEAEAEADTRRVMLRYLPIRRSPSMSAAEAAADLDSEATKEKAAEAAGSAVFRMTAVPRISSKPEAEAEAAAPETITETMPEAEEAEAAMTAQTELREVLGAR